MRLGRCRRWPKYRIIKGGCMSVGVGCCWQGCVWIFWIWEKGFLTSSPKISCTKAVRFDSIFRLYIKWACLYVCHLFFEKSLKRPGFPILTLKTVGKKRVLVKGSRTQSRSQISRAKNRKVCPSSKVIWNVRLDKINYLKSSFFRGSCSYFFEN